MTLGNVNDATVTSVGFSGGGRLPTLGLGPVGHNSFDLVSSRSGQIQLFYTEADGYYTNYFVLGDETALQATEIFLNENASVVPQADSYMIPQLGISITKGVADGSDIYENVARYQGRAVIFSGGVGPFDVVSLDGSYSFGLNEDGQSANEVEVYEGGVGFGCCLPITAAYYLAESHPVGPQIDLPPFLIPVCQLVGQCGN
jgi:hypothetical protein